MPNTHNAIFLVGENNTHEEYANNETMTGGGHVIVDESGSLLTQRSKLKFIGDVTVTDDVVNDVTIVDVEGGGTTIVRKPTVVVRTYTYNGSPQGPTITWDTGMADNCVISNATKTDAGSYTLTIALKNATKMVWDDMSVSDLTYNYSIAKANQTITLSSNSITLDPNNLTADVTVSGAQGAISATTSDNTVATANVSGSTVTISNVNEASGSATITVSVAGTANYNAATDSTISVTAAFYAFPDEWLTAGGLNPSSYADLDAVLADEVALRRLFTIHDSVDVLVNDKAKIGTTYLTTIFNNDYCAKWINLRDYALDTLYADSTLAGIMDTADKYFYGEWALMPQVPTMTSDSTPYGQIIYNSQYSYNPAYYAFNTHWNASYQRYEGWVPASNSNDNYIGYVFPSAKCVTMVELTTFYAQENAKTIKVQASSDGSSWIDITTFISNPSSSPEVITFTNNNSYRYYRLLGDFAYSNTWGYSLQFYEWQPKGNVPVMTSNTTPYGTVICSSEYSESNYPIWYAFDGVDTTGGAWRNNVGGYIGYGFVNPVCAKLIRIVISSEYAATLDEFKIQASNDNSTWTDIEGGAFNIVTNKIVYDIELTNDTYYMYYRLYQTTRNIQWGGWIINSLQFYGREMKVSQSTQPTDGRKYLYVNSKYYTEEWGQYDWDTDNPRHYIYDHGLELETIGNQYHYTSQYTNNPAIRNPGDIETKAPNSSSSSSFVTESKIDLNNYSYLYIRVSQMRQKNGTNYGQFWVSSVKDLYGTVNPVAYANTVDGMTIFVLDISSIADEYYLLIMSALSRWMNVCEWWLE